LPADRQLGSENEQRLRHLVAPVVLAGVGEPLAYMVHNSPKISSSEVVD
jgi:hypothetical protein